PAPEVPGGVEVLARGPVHEAFAEPIVANPAPGMVVSVAPPGPIQEAPPADRPVGAIWIPGYWGWDDDQSNFIWVSGLWRVAPPGCRWVPGYWATVPDGAQWVPGFWMSASVQQVEYLPPPPQSLETGPVSVAPSADTIWVTGCWYHQGYQYAWRPGFWMPARSDWLWVPAHYIWTPRGCVFVAGYWDYGLGGRGLLFAPVRFARPMYLEPAYVYSPTVVIETRYLTIALFARPRYHHYYFGDYFEMNYVGMGFMPWYECRTRYDWYDPIYSYSVWSHRRDDRWEDRERERYEYLRHDRDARPPHTLAMQVQVQQTFLTAPIRDAEHRPVMMAAPLSEVVARRTPPMRFEKLDDGRRNAIQQYAGQLRTYRDQRVAVEAGPDAATSATGQVRSGLLPAEGRRMPTAGPLAQTVRPDLSARPPIDERTPGRPALSPADNGKLDRPALLPQLPAALQPEARRLQPQPQPQPFVSPRPETRLPQPEVRLPQPQPQVSAAPSAPRIVAPQAQAPSASRPEARMPQSQVPVTPRIVTRQPQASAAPSAPRIITPQAQAPSAPRPEIRMPQPQAPAAPSAPRIVAPQPAPSAPRPEIRMPQPPAAPSAPRIVAPQSLSASRPEIRMPQPAPSAPRPEVRMPQPQAPAAPSAPRIVAPQPAPSAPRPEIRAPQPPPSAPRPEIRVPQPAPSAPRPEIRVPQPPPQPARPQVDDKEGAKGRR
ncbi:MAG: hypothetical protein NTX87_14425, partial [Planctomycetota bacterium]|nr:hypothetical protein [Planctomycetota bacterium]